MPYFNFVINGQRHVFEGPDQATTARFAQQWAANPNLRAKPSEADPTFQSVAEQFGRGALQSVSGLADQVRNLLDPGQWAQNAFTLAHGPADLARAAFSGQNPPPGENPGLTVLRKMLAGPAQKAASPITSIQPRNEPERIARTVGAFTPGAASPGSLVRRAAQVVLPALGSESAREAIENVGGGPKAQNVASLLGGLAGGMENSADLVDAFSQGDRKIPINVDSPRKLAVKALQDLKIPVTPGQSVGGPLGWLEDRAMSTAPSLGDAIRGARLRQNDGLNRAAVNTALAPIGETLPAGVQIGNDALAHVESRLNVAKDEANAYALKVTPDVLFGSNLSNISDEANFDIPAWMRQKLNPSLENYMMQLFRSSPGGDYRGVLAKIQENRKAYATSADPTQRALSVHLGNAEDELNALVGRQYPLFKQSQKAIAEAEANLSVLRDATARPGAGENGFTATQLNSAVLAQKARVPKYAYRGPDPAVYGLAKNASAIMGSSIPKAGPAPTPASIGMLGLPSIPYLMTGRGLPNAFEAMNPRAQSLAPIASVQLPMAPISPILPTSLSALSQTAAAQQPPPP